MATPYNQISRDAQDYLTEFSTELDAALETLDVNAWARQFGHVFTSQAVRTIYPIPVSAANYVLRAGDDKMRDLFAKSLDILPVEYIDGFRAKARVVEAPDFIGWVGEPARIARAQMRHPNKMVAALLAANAALDFDGLSLYNDAHPVNVFDATKGTFDNNLSISAADLSVVFDTAMLNLRLRKGPDGELLGLQMTDVIVPAAREQAFKKFLEADFMYNSALAQGANTNLVSANMYRGINLVVAPELDSASTANVFFVDRNGPPPYILQDGGSPEEIRYDKDSELYKNTGTIGMKFVYLAGATGALPHGTVRVTLT